MQAQRDKDQSEGEAQARVQTQKKRSANSTNGVLNLRNVAYEEDYDFGSRNLYGVAAWRMLFSLLRLGGSV